ncbi:hypothetical protein BaRGS_00040270 [Batillaria attramentaria]|uniref:Cytochrome P450 n=1 Tax=Batillaria attramentaria TaxID=370345 RepID=A0ABD0J0Q0_9CAEN
MEALCSVSAGLWLVLGGVTVYLLYKRLTRKHVNLPPGPRGLSALLTTLRAMKNGTLHKVAGDWSEQYGELVLCRTVMGDFCFLNSARLVKEMYASKDREQLTNDRPWLFAGWFLLYGFKDLTTSDSNTSPDWPQRRRLFHQAVKFYGDGVERFESTIQTELRRLTVSIEDSAGEEMDLEKLLSSSLLCVLTVLLTGQCPRPDSDLIQAIKDFDAAVNASFAPSTDTMLATFPFLRFLPGTSYREVCQKLLSTRDVVMEEFFTRQKESHTPGQPRGIVDIFIDEQRKGENNWLTDDNIRCFTIDILSAAYMTSLQTMKAMFLYLLHNPDVTRKVQQEIDDVIGNKRPPRVDDRRKLPYTEAVVMETLRYSSIIPLGVPHLARSDVIIDGVTVPEGAMVLLPFGIGRRSCPGENFARTRIFLYVTTLLQKFDVLPPVEHELPSPDPDLYTNGAVMEPTPYRLIFRPRD